jgi:hypothetical protein
VYCDHINITNKDEINSGEYNVHQCNFNFDEEYDGLVKKALFTREDGKTYEMLINNNVCEIPSDVLQKVGTIIIGVYGYQLENDNLILRYSPTPSSFCVKNGSYIKDIENSSNPTPTELEQVEQSIANIEEQMVNYCTEQQVENIINNTFTTVMGGEY